ncbi:MAG: carbonic anhydrase family protein [Chitinophagales bacterium]
MRHTFIMLLFGILLFQACKLSNKETIKTDSLVAESKQTTSLTGGNQVKVEAPDAIIKSEQGYALPRFDDGLAQSPINILSDSTVKMGNKEIAVKFNIEITAAENVGHTVQIDFKEGSTSMAEGKTYQAKQFHFHTPSEHLIDGMTFPMEMHVVSVLEDTNSAKNPKYLVIALLFRMGHENKFINEFLKTIPPEENKKEMLEPGKVVFKDLFNNIPKDELGSYYTYRGSFTTPPYTESVE